MTKYKRILIVLLALCVFALPVLSQEIFDAAKKGELAKVKALVQKNPDLVKSKNNEDDTPLHIAADAGHLEIARFVQVSRPGHHRVHPGEPIRKVIPHRQGAESPHRHPFQKHRVHRDRKLPDLSFKQGLVFLGLRPSLDQLGIGGRALLRHSHSS